MYPYYNTTSDASHIHAFETPTSPLIEQHSNYRESFNIINLFVTNMAKIFTK